MGRSDQYKQRKKAFTQKKMQFVNGDQSVDLTGRAASSSSRLSKTKKKPKKPVEEEFLSDNTESSNQPRSDDSSDCESNSGPENDLVQSAAALANQQNSSGDKVKIVMWDVSICFLKLFAFSSFSVRTTKFKLDLFSHQQLQQCDPKKCSGRKLQRHGLMKVIPLGRTFGGIILTPTATKCFSKEDADIVLKHGIAVVGKFD